MDDVHSRVWLNEQSWSAADRNSQSSFSLQAVYKLMVGGESRFLLACLSRGFNPSFIYVSTSNLEYMLTCKSIRNAGDFLAAAPSSDEAIELLKTHSPGFIFIHERYNQQEYGELLGYLSQTSRPVKSFLLIDSLELLARLGDVDADVIVADRDLLLPVNPFAQGLMAMVAGTMYRSPTVVEFSRKLSSENVQKSMRRLELGLRDRQLLEAYVLGLSNREIAEQLNLSVRTVQTYSGNLLARLGVNNRQKALLSIAKMGISVVPRFFHR
jgi:DNA-binding NarL/FixJ family response regulator